MPTRVLRDGILESEAVNALSDSGEIFYRRLMSLVDDYGRYEARPAILRTKLFGLQLDRWSEARVADALAECCDVRRIAANGGDEPLISVYEVEGRKYLEITSFGQRARNLPKFPPQSAATRREEQPSAAGGGEVRPTRARGRTESESESESKTSASAAAPPRPPTRPIDFPTTPDYHARYEALYAEHPVPGFKAEGQTRYLERISASVHPEKVADAEDRVHAAWCKFWLEHPTEYRPGIGQYFADGYDLRQPAARASPKPVRVDRTMELARKRDEERRHAQQG